MYVCVYIYIYIYITIWLKRDVHIISEIVNEQLFYTTKHFVNIYLNISENRRHTGFFHHKYLLCCGSPTTSTSFTFIYIFEQALFLESVQKPVFLKKRRLGKFSDLFMLMVFLCLQELVNESVHQRGQQSEITAATEGFRKKTITSKRGEKYTFWSLKKMVRANCVYTDVGMWVSLMYAKLWCIFILQDALHYIPHYNIYLTYNQAGVILLVFD